MEKMNWTPYEDNLLRFLRQQKKMQKWTDIAKALSQDYQIKGRNGKLCKQRYQDKFSQVEENQNWSSEDQKMLFTLHNQIGNKWAVISRMMPGKSDNCIKNHFYSKLRKGLKKLNTKVQQNIGNQNFRQIKFTVLFKIIEANQESFKNNQFCQEDTSKYCYGTNFNNHTFIELKNKLVALSHQSNRKSDFNEETFDCRELYEEINSFSRNYKRKPKKFRRIPTKPQQLKKIQQQTIGILKQKSQQKIQQSSTTVFFVPEEDNGLLEAEQLSAFEFNESNPFKNFQQQGFLSTKKTSNLRARKQSAQTTGFSEQIWSSFFFQQEAEQLPMLMLSKNQTSNFNFFDEQ